MKSLLFVGGMVLLYVYGHTPFEAMEWNDKMGAAAGALLMLLAAMWDGVEW